MVFLSLPGDLAGPVEAEFAALFPVFSKASAHRMEKDVPLMVPEINPDHVDLYWGSAEVKRLERFHNSY